MSNFSLSKLIIGNTKGFIRGKALSVEGHTHSYAAVTHTHTIAQITSLQSEINSLKSSVSNGKSAVASAITDKGVSTSATASFDTMASNIRKLNVSTGKIETVYASITTVTGWGDGIINLSFQKPVQTGPWKSFSMSLSQTSLYFSISGNRIIYNSTSLYMTISLNSNGYITASASGNSYPGSSGQSATIIMQGVLK